MRFACEQCQTKYSIPDERVRGKILKIRCKNCSCLISVSEAGVRTTRPAEPPSGSLAGSGLEGDGGDSTMIGGMADFLGKPGFPPEPEDWHLSVDGNQNGPMVLSDLAQRLIEQAGSSAELFVWRDGFEGWKAVDTVPEVQQALEKLRGSSSSRLAPARSASQSAPALDALDSDGGDATQIGSLNLASALAGQDDDDVQDASLLGLEADAMESLTEPPRPSPMRPAGKPAAPPPPKLPPPFKSPPGSTPQPPAQTPNGAARPPAAFGLPPAAPPAPTPPLASPPSAAMPGTDPTPALGSLVPPQAALASASPEAPPPMHAALPSAPPIERSLMAVMQFSEIAPSSPQPPPKSPERARPKLPLLVALGLVLVLGGGAGYWMLTRSGPPGPGKTETPSAEVSDAGAPAGGGPDAGSKTAAGAKVDEKSAGKEAAGKEALAGLSKKDLESLLADGEKALAKCKKAAKHGAATLHAEVEVSAKGKATKVSLEGPDSDGKLGKCVEKAVKKWKFPKGPDKKPYQARFPVSLK